MEIDPNDPFSFLRQYLQPPEPPKSNETYVKLKTRLADLKDLWQGDSIEATIARALIDSHASFVDGGMHPEKFMDGAQVDASFYQVVTNHLDGMIDTIRALEALGAMRKLAIEDYKSTIKEPSERGTE